MSCHLIVITKTRIYAYLSGDETTDGAVQKVLLHLIALTSLLAGLMKPTESYAETDFKVTLLGTGTPIPYPDRSGPSTLVEAGNQKLLFDAGRGVPVRLRQITVMWRWPRSMQCS